MSQELICDLADGIARMKINRPEARNAMTGAVIQEMLAFCRRIENDPAEAQAAVSRTLISAHIYADRPADLGHVDALQLSL